MLLLLHRTEVEVSLLLMLIIVPVVACSRRQRPESSVGSRRRCRGRGQGAHVVKVAAAAAAVHGPTAGRRRGALLLQRSLLDVVGELSGRHSIRLLPVRLELGRPELCLGKRTGRVGDGLVVRTRLEGRETRRASCC
jgi:hypothetical protein